MRIALLVYLILHPLYLAAAPDTFEQAKMELRTYVYHDREDEGDFYCGCRFDWVGRSGGIVDLESCGYQIRAQPVRAQRIEWEHILPASSIGQARQCWQDGGRQNCNRTDPVFNMMEADMHNLTPAIGEVNADRSNFRFSELSGEPAKHGACDFRVSFTQRAAQPRNEIKGLIARTYFYMHDRYDLNMSDAQQRLMMAWHRLHPVSDWEQERDRRIASRMGHGNPFVSGLRVWTLGHRNSAAGVVTWLPDAHPAPERKQIDPIMNSVILGNRNSKVYHLPEGCPSYDQVSERNIIPFQSVAEAEAAGYRKAGNCR